MPKRSDSTALQLLQQSMPRETPQTLLAAARLQMPSANVVSTYPIEQVPVRDDRRRVVALRHGERGNAITAAAAQLNGSEEKSGRRTPRRRKRAAERWQNEIWDLRDESPELRFLGDRQARAASQSRIYIGHHTAGDVGDPERITEGPVGDLAQQLFGSLPEVESKLKRYVQQIVFTGESIVNVRHDDDGKLAWQVHSSTELLGSQAGQYQITDGVTPRKVDDENEILARSWTPSPKLFELADAPVKALLPVLRELVQMSKYVSAQIDSKLASGGGLLLVRADIAMTDKDGNRVDFATELQEYMMTAVEDRASAESLAPLVATVPALEGVALSDSIHLQTFSDTLDPHMHERRAEAIRRIALGMDSDPGVLDGAGSMNHWCNDDETEVYTRRGWVGPDRIEIGDECLSLDHETGLTVWKPVVDLYRADVVNEPMLSIEGRFHSSLTTMGHRWPVQRRRHPNRETVWSREWMTSSEIVDLGANYTGQTQLPIKISRAARHGELPAVTKYSDSFVELVAWLFTEGGLTYREGAQTPNRVVIYQSHAVNADNCARIRAALTAEFGPAREYGTVGRPTKAQEQIAWWREIQEGERTRFVLSKAAWSPLVDVAPHRIVDLAFVDELTHSQLLLFIDTAIRGDGSISGPNRVLTQKRPEMLDAFERACFLAGLTTTRREVDIKGFQLHRQHKITVSSRVEYQPRVNTVSVQGYTGTVWCPTVADTHTVLARRRGHVFYTGQSAWSLDEAEIKLGVAPIMTTFCHTMTSQVVRPLLAAAGVENVDEFSVWFDTSALKLRPDKSKDAQWLYEQKLLAGGPTLAEHGFDGNDLPTPEEIAKRVLAENLIPLLSQFGQQPGAAVEILRAIGVNLPETQVPDQPGAATPAVAGPPTGLADTPTNSPPDTYNDPAGSAPTPPETP